MTQNTSHAVMAQSIRLEHGDCLEVMREMIAEGVRVDAVICDPPYHLASIVSRLGKPGSAAIQQGTDGAYARASKGFMGKEWDGGDIAFRSSTWQLALMLLKPGGHLVAFGGTKGWHRLACAIEDAGAEIRDTIAWLYGSGMPKSHNAAKGLDAHLGQEGARIAEGDEVRRIRPGADQHRDGSWEKLGDRTYQPHHYEPATDEARQWQGWGTALKPAWENIIVAQKPCENGELLNIIGSNLQRIEGRLWSLLPASAAAEIFRLSPSEFAEACAFARWSVDESLNTQAGLSALMDTSQFVSAIASSLNTVWSWKSTLAALLSAPSTSIIETELRTTTDWKTLRFCLSQITPRSIVLSAFRVPGQTQFAEPAARYFSAELSKLSATLELSALANAIELEQRSFLAGAVRPAFEPIILAQRPFDGSVASALLRHGVGALNIDACRVPSTEALAGGAGGLLSHQRDGKAYPSDNGYAPSDLGRWPANVVHDGSDEVLDAFAAHGSNKGAIAPVTRRGADKFRNTYGEFAGQEEAGATYRGDTGTAARFFYSAKANAKDRAGSKHPTIKPIALMRWLARLVTPPGGLILDPFAGSGTTGAAAMQEGFRAILIEREAEYVADIRRRLAAEGVEA